MSALPGHHPPGVNRSAVSLGHGARTLASNNQVLHRLQLIAQRIHHPFGS